MFLFIFVLLAVGVATQATQENVQTETCRTTQGASMGPAMLFGEQEDVKQDDLGDLPDEFSWIRRWTADCAALRPVLAMDEARVSLLSATDEAAILWHENSQCVGCPMRELLTVSGRGNDTTKVQTAYTNHLWVTLLNTPNVTLCQFTELLEQGGDYWMVLKADLGTLKCTLHRMKAPPNAFLPILYLFIGLVSLTIIYAILSKLHSSGTLQRLVFWKHSVDLTQDYGTTTIEMTLNGVIRVGDTGKGVTPKPQPTPARKRLVSLDTFRGLSLVVMIFVNYGGGGYYFFQHVPWNGLAVADLVFPWFVFMMGTSIPLSFRGMMKRKVPRWRITYRVVKRTVELFLIGISLNSRWFSYLSELRVPGVLQRLALTYFLTALPHVFFARTSHREKGWLSVVGDVTDYWPEWIVNTAYLTTHLCLTFLLPVPGCPTGYIGPGGMHDGGDFFNCSGGAAGYIDRIVLTDNHIYQNPTFKTIYHGSLGFDPEGILGTLSSAFTCFLGLQAGKILLYHKSHSGKLIRWSAWAVLTGAIGLALCQASLNDGPIPINKNLWSVSFALVIAATGFACLTIFYLLTDLTLVWSGAPFLYPGLNSLVVYCCHDVFGSFFPVRWRVEAAHWSTLLMATWGTAFWVIFAYVLFRKKIFIAL